MQMQESSLLNQNARKVAVKVLVKDDMPMLYQKHAFYPENKNDFFVYDQFNKNLTQKYTTKSLHESMLNLCQQYNSSMQLFPYFNYYHPALVTSIAHEDELNPDQREQHWRNRARFSGNYRKEENKQYHYYVILRIRS